ncbi:hypothetical protein VHEMI00853 [[Torrubiella] hemipterigena]|uniref:C2H2-type domain-containing protein n=1 Tax=[Torrubiella] hemipterigena TaxID=1531966 RepID=A0A0A1T363_9HYPO|nr:hypothetical protein VHEMI00853 [[Torrubiella] hemipterigena]
MTHLEPKVIERIQSLINDLKSPGSGALAQAHLAEIEKLVQPIPIHRRQPAEFQSVDALLGSSDDTNSMPGANPTQQWLLQNQRVNISLNMTQQYINDLDNSLDNGAEYLHPLEANMHHDDDASLHSVYAMLYNRPASYAGGDFSAAEFASYDQGPPSLPPDWHEHASPSNGIFLSPGPSPNLAPVRVAPSSCPSMESGTSALDIVPLTRQNSRGGGMAALAQAAPMADTSYASGAFEDYDIPHDLLGISFSVNDGEASTRACSTVSLSPCINPTIPKAGLSDSIDDVPLLRAQSAPDSSTLERAGGTQAARRRPKPVKKTCGRCSKQFRGVHELRRHINTTHEGRVTQYICQDPAQAGILSPYQPLVPFSKCAYCMAGKTYRANYNAAAHLRRIHFKPRQPRNRNNDSSEPKRGGHGGGDWPPMADLANVWFREVSVPLRDTIKTIETPILEEGEEDAEGDMMPDLDTVPFFPTDEELDLRNEGLTEMDLADFEFSEQQQQLDTTGFVSPQDYLYPNNG